jgi:hypothetical protein
MTGTSSPGGLIFQKEEQLVSMERFQGNRGGMTMNYHNTRRIRKMPAVYAKHFYLLYAQLWSRRCLQKGISTKCTEHLKSSRGRQSSQVGRSTTHRPAMVLVLVHRINKSLSQRQWLRAVLGLGSRGARASLGCSQAGKRTYSSTWRYRDLDVFRTAWSHMIRKIRNLDPFGNVVVAGRYNLEMS